MVGTLEDHRGYGVWSEEVWVGGGGEVRVMIRGDMEVEMLGGWRMFWRFLVGGVIGCFGGWLG